MHCKKCGNALGTNLAVCPNCGATLSPEQLKVVEEEKRKMFGNPELLTEKYGEKVVYRNEQKGSRFLASLVTVSVIILVIFVILLVGSIIH